jgi:hypothetical protein
MFFGNAALVYDFIILKGKILANSVLPGSVGAVITANATNKDMFLGGRFLTGTLAFLSSSIPDYPIPLKLIAGGLGDHSEGSHDPKFMPHVYHLPFVIHFASRYHGFPFVIPAPSCSGPGTSPPTTRILPVQLL